MCGSLVGRRPSYLIFAQKTTPRLWDRSALEVHRTCHAMASVDGKLLADAIRAHGHRNVRFVAELDEIVAGLPESLLAGDLLITLGAGSISSLGPRLLDALADRGDT